MQPISDIVIHISTEDVREGFSQPIFIRLHKKANMPSSAMLERAIMELDIIKKKYADDEK